MAGPHSTLQLSDHSTLEAVPAGLEPAHHQNWGAQSQKEHYYQRDWTEASEGAMAPDTPKQTILGLSVRRFWAIVIILVVVLAAAIGGGVGGGLAASRSQAGSSSSAASDQPGNSSSTQPHAETATGSTGTSTISTGSSSTGSSSTTTQTESPTKTTSTPAGGTSPAPTDAGCPNINGTSFSPLDAQGKAIPLSKGAAPQSFLRVCDINWPAGAEFGNPGIHDIMKVYLPSLEDCITACASYNVNYQANVAKGVADASGLCRAVGIVKTAGEFCYLKNATGKVGFVYGKAEMYSSALLL